MLMLISAIPFTAVSAADDRKVLDGNALDSTYSIGCAGLHVAISEADGKSILHGTVAAGTYANNALQVTFKPDGFGIVDYPFIKIGYRTDSESKILDVSSRSTVGESWQGKHPECKGDGKWNTLVIDLADLTGGAGPIPSDDKEAKLVLKPFGTIANLTSSKYFDIEYIACFKSKSDAEAYTFDKKDVTRAEVSEDTAKRLETFFYEKADDALIKKYIDETDALIKEIKNSPTTVTVTGTKYYVSASGNDSNDGLTSETAWKTVNKVNAFEFKPGDGVFFKRGDSWRITEPLSTKEGVTYSAYGEGAKPKLIASVDGSGSGKWIPTNYPNIYMFAEKIPDTRDVGTIVFDGGRAWGVQVQKKKDGSRMANGTVFNGIETYESEGGNFDDMSAINNNLEFYHNWDNKTLYLYCKDGNPGDVFSSIEIVDKGHGINGKGIDVVIDNIDIFGAGSHGIGYGDVKNLTVQYCTLSWIGGSIQGKYIFGQDYGVRYGNAIESYGSSDNFTIRYCYATQVYDCCWTVQNQSAVDMNNVQMYKNVTEFCNTGLEVWNGGGSITNMNLHDNYTRYNGYGWSHQRPNKDGNFFYGAANTSGVYENNNVTNNVNYFTSCYALLVAATAPNQYNFHDNVYIMENDKKMGGISANPGKGTGGTRSTNYTEEELKRCYLTGFETGSKFYYTDPNPFGNMYDMYDPKNGVKVFTDIGDDFWGRDAIDFVSLRGYFNGVTENTFSANGTMTRGMLVTVLSRIAGEKGDVSTMTFTDVNKNAWFAEAAAWAEANGIVDKGGKFRPDDKATREELADMLYRYAYSRFKKTDVQAKSFSDMNTVTEKYLDGVKFCTGAGIINGYENGTVQPKNSATRAEVATMIKRFTSFLSNAEIDTERALASANKVELSGDELKAALDNNQVRATVLEDKTVKFTTFTESGRPQVRVMNSLTDKLNFADYPYAVVKFDSKLPEGYVIASLMVDSGLNSFSETGIKSSAATDSGVVTIEFSDYASGVKDDAKNLAIRIMPWGEDEVALNKEDYFIIKSVTFFDSAYAAEAFAALN